MKKGIVVGILFFLQFFVLNTVHGQALEYLVHRCVEYRSHNDYENAVIYAKKAITHAQLEYSETDTVYALCLNNLAAIYHDMGEYKKAELLYLQASEIIKIKVGINNAWYATNISNLALLYQDMGEYVKSESMCIQALDIKKVLLGEGHPDYLISVNNLGLLYQQMGEYSKSETLLNKAIAIGKSRQNENSPIYATCLNNMGLLYQKIGEYDKAEPLYLEAKEIRKIVLGEGHLDYAVSLNNLASLYKDLGQYETAEPLYREATEILKIVLGENHPDYATSLEGLALLYQAMGEYVKAENLCIEVTEVRKTSLGDSHPAYAVSLNNLANLYIEMGNYSKAESLCLKALEIRKIKFGENHPDYANSLNNLAAIYSDTKQYLKAEKHYLQAMGILQNIFDETHPFYATAVSNLALLYQNMGEYPKAEPLYAKGKKIILKNADKNFSFLPEQQKEKYVATVAVIFELYKYFFLQYHMQSPFIAADAFDLELSTKGMILNAGVEMRQTILYSGNDSALAIYDSWLVNKAVLAKQYSLPIAKMTIDINEKEIQTNDLEQQLIKMSNAFKQSKSLLTTNWQDIHQNLSADEVAIEFSSFRSNNGKNVTDSTLYVALVLRKNDSFPTMVPLCEQRQLDSIMKKTGNTDVDFIAGLYRAVIVDSSITMSYGKRLYDLVWKPLDTLLTKGQTIYFAPSGTLHQIAFAAIPYDSNTLLSDRYQLNQLSTTSMLLHQSKFTEKLPTSVALFGGVEYDVSTSELMASAQKKDTATHYVSRSLPSDLERGNGFEYLPGSLQEVKGIAALCKSKKVNVNSYTGKLATEEAVKSLTGKQSPRVLHISTHGFFFPDPKKETKNNISGENSQPYRSSDNPLNRAGLLFAGANKAWKGDTLPAGMEDGILTAYEASNITLSNTELVVLSACETGLGEIKGSEGVFGLQRAFRMAGAENLMMSLWKVPDYETAEFMTYFYTSWFSGKPIHDAFLFTQNEMKRKYPKQPYKWAAFVLVR